MTTPCHPIPASLAQHYLAQTKAALCDRPGETQAENAERTKRMVHTAMGFEPRDGMEYMLATLVQAQYEVILKATKDALQDAASPKAVSALAAMSRVMLSTIRALKTARARPLAEDAEPAQTAAPGSPKPQAAEATPPRPARPVPRQPPLPDRKTVTPLPGLPRPPAPAFHAPPKAA